ncbi:unnamed protein product [Lathyrus sativus]|nr:unnamed protein product [Lathyrus sativus]
MDNQQRSPLLTWAYYCQGKSVEELKQSLIYTTMELEQTRATVQEELRKRDEQLLNLKDILNKVIRERDEAHEKCQRLFLDKLLFQQQQQQQKQDPLSGISSVEDEQQQQQQHKRGIESSNNNGLSSSDCEESIVSSPATEQQQPMMMIELIAKDKPLPEKGKLLQAVMKAGPLLQTLLLAGPLPQWRHPPPPLESFEIPPVTIPSPTQQILHHQDSSFLNTNCGRFSSRKRVFGEGSDSPSADNKYQRIVLH